MKRFIGTTVLTIATLTALTLPFVPTRSTQAAAPTDARVKAMLDKLGWKYEVDDDGDFKVTLKLKDERTQLVWITSTTQKLGGLEIRHILSPAYTVQGPLPAEVANQLLVDSSLKKLGGWQVVKTNQGRHVALFAAKVNANSTQEDLETAIAVAVQSADEMERSLSKEDKF